MSVHLAKLFNQGGSFNLKNMSNLISKEDFFGLHKYEHERNGTGEAGIYFYVAYTCISWYTRH